MFFLVALVVVVLDRVTKSIVTATVPYGTEVPVLGNLVGITNVRNSGAAFGFAPVGPWFFLLASVVCRSGWSSTSCASLATFAPTQCSG